jgi:hypothetical protein
MLQQVCNICCNRQQAVCLNGSQKKKKSGAKKLIWQGQKKNIYILDRAKGPKLASFFFYLLIFFFFFANLGDGPDLYRPSPSSISSLKPNGIHILKDHSYQILSNYLSSLRRHLCLVKLNRTIIHNDGGKT